MTRTFFTRYAAMVSVMALVAGLFGCDQLAGILLAPDEGKHDGTDALYEPIAMDIGMVAPLTGVHADRLGKSMAHGFNLARTEINNSPLSPVRINFIVEDDMSTVPGTLAAFDRLLATGVPAIVGIPISTHAKQAFPVAQDNQVVAFSSTSSSAGLSGIGDYIFRAGLAADKLSPAGVRATHEKLRYQRVAMLYDEVDVYSTSSNEQLTTALEPLNADVVATQTFRTGDSDFSIQLTAILESEPEVLFVSALPVESVKIMVQGREIGITAPYIIPELALNEAHLAGDAAEGTITFLSWSKTLDNPINQAFVENYQSTYGSEPDPWAAQSYATLHILHAAIVNALAADTEAPDATAIRDALAMVDGFDTNLGSFSFDPNGEAVYEPVVLKVKDGQFELFENTQISEGM